MTNSSFREEKIRMRFNNQTGTLLTQDSFNREQASITTLSEDEPERFGMRS